MKNGSIASIVTRKSARLCIINTKSAIICQIQVYGYLKMWEAQAQPHAAQPVNTKTRCIISHFQMKNQVVQA